MDDLCGAFDKTDALIFLIFSILICRSASRDKYKNVNIKEEPKTK